MKKLVSIFLCSFLLLTTGCKDNSAQPELLNVVSTTTMLHDLVCVIGKDKVNAVGLMGDGVDPHLYKASALDVTLLQEADVVIYNGLNLEGKIIDIFKDYPLSICVGDAFSKDMLIENDLSIDPHIWYDVSLWAEACSYVANSLADIDPKNKAYYLDNLQDYLNQLNDLEIYILDKVQNINQTSRVLITAHDAFSYFGKAYGFEILSLQGISTVSEASTFDISNLANYIFENQIKAIFLESSVSSKNIEALQEAVYAKGFNVSIGGSLYSDSLATNSTYIETVKLNIDTIFNALK